MDRVTSRPDQALADSLENLMRRVNKAEMRGSWPSALQQSSVEVNAALAVPTTSASPPVYYAVTSLLLDPGRWVLFGQVTHENTRVSIPDIGDSPYYYHLKVTHELGSPSDPLNTERESIQAAVTPDGFGVLLHQEVGLEATADLPTRATLWVASRSRPIDPVYGVGISVAYFLYAATLIAFPG